MQPSAPLTLKRLTEAISYTVHSTPHLMGVWVIAELSDVRVNGGHCYMELLEKNAAGQTEAKLRATIWQSVYSVIGRKFYEATGKPVSTGLKVLLRGNVNHHSVYGLSFNVTDIDPSYTLGDMARIRREIIDRLQREGLLNRNKLNKMPMAPQRIAVISAEGAAGYGDFITHLSTNGMGYVFYPYLFKAVMQGDKTSQSVRSALEKIGRSSQYWDCVAIIRGGGATTDLNGFDDYELAKSVALFPLPIIVGIGHQRDNTVLDEVAHTRVITPTQAADVFVKLLLEAESRANAALSAVAQYAAARLSGEAAKLVGIESTVPALARRVLDSAAANLKKEMARIPVLVTSRIGREGMKLSAKIDMIRTLTGNIISIGEKNISDLENRIKEASLYCVAKEDANLTRLMQLIEVLSPANTLKRGYSITRVDGKALKSISDIHAGVEITTILSDGEVKSVVS